MEKNDSTPRRKKHSKKSLIDRFLSLFRFGKRNRHPKKHRHYNVFKKNVSSDQPLTFEKTGRRHSRRIHSRKLLSHWTGPLMRWFRSKRPLRHAQAKEPISTPVRKERHRLRKKTGFLSIFRFKKTSRPQKPRQTAQLMPSSALPETRKKHSSSKGILKRITKFFRNIYKSYREPLHNFLYFLNLRSTPYDPFLDPEAFSHKDSKVIRFQRYLVYAFNSIVMFIISYIAAYLLYQFTVMLSASVYGIDSVLYYYEVMFPIGNASPLWNPFNIIMITLSGPLISIILGLVWYRVLLRRASTPLARLFFLWLSFHSFNQFFGAFVAGVITDQGFGYVANWMYLGIPLKMLFSMMALSVLGYLGWRSARHILATSNSPQRINRYNRPYFILSQTVLPWLLGSLILLYIKIPNRTPQHENIIVYDAIILGSLMFMAITPLFNWRAKPYEGKYMRYRKKTRYGWLFLLAAIGLILAYRLGLERGIHIIIKFVFSLRFYN